MGKHDLKSHQRWVAVGILFSFMLLHQTDRLLIGPLTSAIMAEFKLTEVGMGGVMTGALILGSVFYPIWGYLYDRFARPKLLALASFIWGITTWLSAIAPTARFFLISRASTGIDDSSYPGIASLISDYFSPEKRSRIFGFLQLSIPLGYLLGLKIALGLGGSIGWRFIYLFTGLLGVLLSIVIYFFVKDLPRGSSEPDLAAVSHFPQEKLDLPLFVNLLSIPSLRFIFIQSFIGVLPWQVITFWSFRYLEVERNYSPQNISSIMIPAVLIIGAGYFFGGVLGDLVYSQTKRGRLFVSTFGVILGAVFITLTLSTPPQDIIVFKILLWITCFLIPLPSPNIAATIFDVVLPEIRSTAASIQFFLGNLGSAFAPLLAGVIAQTYSLGTALLSISLVSWIFSSVLLGISAYYLPSDHANMRQELRERIHNQPF